MFRVFYTVSQSVRVFLYAYSAPLIQSFVERLPAWLQIDDASWIAFAVLYAKLTLIVNILKNDCFATYGRFSLHAF